MGSLGNVMNRRFLAIAALLLLSLAGIGTAFADRGHYHGRVGVGVVIGPYWGPWYYPPPYYYPPVIIERPAPPVYIEQIQPTETAAKTDYWYYCQSRGGYYPYVKECPDGWMKVVPRP